MASKMTVVLVMGLVITSLVSIASATSGTATFYTTYVPSACYGSENHGTMIAAASDKVWNNRAACGKKYKVKCTGGTNQGIPHPCRGNSVTVKIVDYCPTQKGCKATLDLSKEAFSAIANPDAGKINIEYHPA